MTRWPPKSISLPDFARFSSTRPAQVSTDVGDAFIKPMWDDCDPDRLARDYIGLQLAHLMRLPVPLVGIYSLGPAERIRTLHGNECLDGPALITSKLDLAYWNGQVNQLRTIANVPDIAALGARASRVRRGGRHSPTE